MGPYSFPVTWTTRRQTSNGCRRIRLPSVPTGLNRRREKRALRNSVTFHDTNDSSEGGGRALPRRNLTELTRIQVPPSHKLDRSRAVIFQKPTPAPNDSVGPPRTHRLFARAGPPGCPRLPFPNSLRRCPSFVVSPTRTFWGGWRGKKKNSPPVKALSVRMGAILSSRLVSTPPRCHKRLALAPMLAFRRLVACLKTFKIRLHHQQRQGRLHCSHTLATNDFSGG